MSWRGWLGAVVLLLASCEADNDTVWIHEADNGQTVAAAAGKRVNVKLWGNPSTGYTWNAVPLETNTLTATGWDFTPEADTPGAGGFYMFGYRAEAAGRAAIQMIYNRPYLPNDPTARGFQVVIAVEP